MKYVHERQRKTGEFEQGEESCGPVMEEGVGIDVPEEADGAEEKVVAQWSPAEDVDVMAAGKVEEMGGVGTPEPQGDEIGIGCEMKGRTEEEKFEDGSAIITREEKEHGTNSLDDEGESRAQAVGEEQNGLGSEGLSRETEMDERGENKEEDSQYNLGEEAGMKVSPKRKRGRKRRHPAKRQQAAEGKRRGYCWKIWTTFSRVVSLSNYQSRFLTLCPF